MLRLFAIRSIPGWLLLIAGIVIAAVDNNESAWFIVGLAMVGLGTVAVVAQFFYEVGRSEDRDRERERRRR
jgi:hypothetical protein